AIIGGGCADGCYDRRQARIGRWHVTGTLHREVGRAAEGRVGRVVNRNLLCALFEVAAVVGDPIDAGDLAPATATDQPAVARQREAQRGVAIVARAATCA